MNGYDAKSYWQKRLSSDFSISGTGHTGFSPRYNRFMYALKRRALDKALERNGISVTGKNVLDLGCGSGFFVEYYTAAGARSVTGADIADVSVEKLRARFPSDKFFRMDISSGDTPIREKFDIINAFDVLYHIVSDEDFRSAAKNVGAWAAPGAWVFITDALRPANSASAHVRYRDLDTYRDILDANGIVIKEVIPVMNMMSRDLRIETGFETLRRAFAASVEAMAWLSYLIDRVYCPAKGSTMSLIAGSKR